MENKRKLPKELIQEKAYLSYLVMDTGTEVAEEVGVAPSTIFNWIHDNHWDIKKKRFYETVHTKLETMVDDLVDKKAVLLQKTIKRLEHLIDVDIEEAELGTKLEIATAFSKIAETLSTFDIHAIQPQETSPVTINIDNSDEYRDVFAEVEAEISALDA